jgi:hypothetical protein
VHTAAVEELDPGQIDDHPSLVLLGGLGHARSKSFDVARSISPATINRGGRLSRTRQCSRGPFAGPTGGRGLGSVCMSCCSRVHNCAAGLGAKVTGRGMRRQTRSSDLNRRRWADGNRLER